jgi:hypothetical protein
MHNIASPTSFYTQVDPEQESTDSDFIGTLLVGGTIFVAVGAAVEMLVVGVFMDEAIREQIEDNERRSSLSSLGNSIRSSSRRLFGSKRGMTGAPQSQSRSTSASSRMKAGHKSPQLQSNSSVDELDGVHGQARDGKRNSVAFDFSNRMEQQEAQSQQSKGACE